MYVTVNVNFLLIENKPVMKIENLEKHLLNLYFCMGFGGFFVIILTFSYDAVLI